MKHQKKVTNSCQIKSKGENIKTLHDIKNWKNKQGNLKMDYSPRSFKGLTYILGSCLIKEHSFISTTTRIKKELMLCIQDESVSKWRQWSSFHYQYWFDMSSSSENSQRRLKPNETSYQDIIFSYDKKTNRISSFLHVKSRNSAFLFAWEIKWMTNFQTLWVVA